MTAKELKNYLNGWPEEREVVFLAIKPKDRIVWYGDQIEMVCITDGGAPVIGLELYDSEPMDQEMIQAAEEDEAAGQK